MTSHQSDIVTGLNDNHKRALLSTFRSIDEQLAELVGLLEPAQAQSPLSDYVPDATPVQHRVITDYATRIRVTMRRVLEEQNVHVPHPSISAIWAARCRLISVEIALEEIRSSALRGYGRLSSEASREVDLFLAELRDCVSRMETYLAQGSGRDLRARLERLEQITGESDLLRMLERVVTARGLIEFRPALAILIERLEASSFEVAVFGRVSSGKSSLLDYILQTDVLPIGLTPVTAVPTRVNYGATAGATVSFAESPTITIEPHRLVEFASEQHNPCNTKHVTRIEVQVPATSLKEGVTFVDTPGLGSLAAGGAEESLAYLPRCDLGIVLVDASSTLIPEDLITVHALYQAGATVMVLLSKADMLNPEDTQRAAAYVSGQLQANLGMQVPVHLVSIKGEAATLSDRWFNEELLPCLEEHKRLTKASLRRKITGLLDLVVASLRKRLARAEPGRGRVDAAETTKAKKELFSALLRLDAAMRTNSDFRSQASTLAKLALEGAVLMAAACWPKDGCTTFDITSVVVEAVGRVLTPTTVALAQDLLELRLFLTEALQSAEHVLGEIEKENLPKPSGMPAFESTFGNLRVVISRPTLALMGSRLTRRGIRKQLSDRITSDVIFLLDQYARRLDDWRLQYWHELRAAFTAKEEVYRAQLEKAVEAPTGLEAQERQEIQTDIASLQTVVSNMTTTAADRKTLL